jgi:hypothetical protein
MRRDLLAVSTAAAFACLLLTACGTQHAGARTHATSADAPSCTTPTAPTAAAGPGTSAAQPKAPSPQVPSPRAADAVRLTGAAGCPVFEVTNTTGATATFTITYQLLSDSGAALSSSRQTVPSVAPGRTVRRAVEAGRGAGDPGGRPRVRIIKVRSVPTAQAPSMGGPCPPSGVHLYADDGDAAMGLRVVGLHVRNCGTGTYTLDGYPQLRLFDEDHQAVGTVRIVHGGDAVATGTGADGPPRPLVLGPGQGAHAELVWRNTTGLGSDLVNAPYVQVVPKPGTAAVMVTPELDLGTTGKLAVGPWQSEAANGR